MKLRIAVVSRGLVTPDLCGVEWKLYLDEGLGHLPMAQKAYEELRDKCDVIGYPHDDVVVHESEWDKRVLAEFDDPKVAVVGFGGATGMGHEDIYKIPYHYTQLARVDFVSNLRDAEVHGRRNAGAEDVAFLDSFTLFVRTSFLNGQGGWPIDRYAPMHLGDAWLCLTALQKGYRVRMVGVDCSHTGGGRGAIADEWAATTKWGSYDAMHKHNHLAVYEDFRGLLPLRLR